MRTYSGVRVCSRSPLLENDVVFRGDTPPARGEGEAECAYVRGDPRRAVAAVQNHEQAFDPDEAGVCGFLLHLALDVLLGKLDLNRLARPVGVTGAPPHPDSRQRHVLVGDGGALVADLRRVQRDCGGRGVGTGLAAREREPWR